MDLNDQFVKNYVDFQFGKCEPIIKGRIAQHALFWKELGTSNWLYALLTNGVKIPLKKKRPGLFFLIVNQQ